MKCPQCFFTDEAVSDETCRRCSRNFTRTELVEVVFLGLIYLLICRFSYYLFTGDFFTHPLKGGVFFPVRFSDIFTFPVSLSENPWHILTVGWTFALVLLIPMLVGLFYGAAAGMIVAFVGAYHVVAPFYVLLVMLSALIAGTRVRNLLHLEASLLLGAVPPMLFLFVLSLPALLGRVGIVVFLPWLVAIFLVVISISPVIWLARRWDYRMRPLLWVMGLQVVVVMGIFHGTVGFSKVEYEFTRRMYWAGSPRFRMTVDGSGHGADEQHASARAECERRRSRSLKEFSRFISWFPRSAETPCALFERAELRNLRSYFTGTRPDLLRVYTDRITHETLQDYQTIRTDFSGSPCVVEARLCAGRYFLQIQELDKAVRELRDLIDYCDVKVPLRYRGAGRKSVLLRWRTHRLSREERVQLLYEVLQEARIELRFLERNADYNRIPLLLFYQLDEHEKGYAAELAKIVKWFPDSRLADNVKLILLERRSYSLEELEKLLDAHPKGDAAPRMLLLLGTGCYDRLMYARAEKFLRRLTVEFPESPEAARAEARLKNLKRDVTKH